MKNSKFTFIGLASLIFISLSIICSCSQINSVNDPHFTEDGKYIVNSKEKKFSPQSPLRIKFYVEESGSMNGFFRPNIPTHFKADLWRILGYYSLLSPDVTMLTNNGEIGETIPLDNFQTKMNTGDFVSSASTKVPLMLQSIISDLKPNKGEVAVLVSDMKYSPVGLAAPEVLLTEYSTDIAKVLGTYGKSVCLIGATSNYADKTGKYVVEKSPYYYFLIGNGEQVASVRNDISSMLEMDGHLIDNIESGFDYSRVKCDFGNPKNCLQLEEEPTFIGFEEDTCTIRMKIHLESYRWIMTDPKIFKESFSAKAIYGSNVSFKIVKFEIENITEIDGKKELERKATAIVDLKVFDMAQDSEVIEWTLNLPNMNITNFSPFFGASDEYDVTKSYSVDKFIRGMFEASVVNKSLKPNYILISRQEE